MYLVIDTTSQNGTMIGRVVSKHFSFARANSARGNLQAELKEEPRKGKTPVIWREKWRQVKVGEMVKFADPRLFILTKAELKQIEN